MSLPSIRNKLTFFTPFAGLLSGASLVWTGWSITDLIGAQEWGLTVALSADMGWTLILVAEYRGYRLVDRWKRSTEVVGWLLLLTVMGFLSWHGIQKENPAMAAAGPVLPAIAKMAWHLDLAARRKPEDMTPDQKTEIDDLIREASFEGAKREAERKRARLDHEDAMAKIEMDADLSLARAETDFKVEITRIEKGAEIRRRAPLLLPELPQGSGAEPLALGWANPYGEPPNASANPEPNSFGEPSNPAPNPLVEPPNRTPEPQGLEGVDPRLRATAQKILDRGGMADSVPLSEIMTDHGFRSKSTASSHRGKAVELSKKLPSPYL